MAFGSAGSPNGSQPILLNYISQRRRRSIRQGDIESAKDGSKLIMLCAIFVAAVTLVMCFTCTKVYIGSAPDLGITGFLKKAVFMVFLLWNSISMLSSVAALVFFFWIQHLSEFRPIQMAILKATTLIALAFVSVLVAFIVGACLVFILLPWGLLLPSR